MGLARPPYSDFKVRGETLEQETKLVSELREKGATVIGFGGAFLSTTPANIVGDVIRGKSGQVIALWQMSGDAGMIIGPLTVGFISDIFSFRAAFAVSAAVFSVAVLLAYRLPETRRSHLPSS